MRSKYTVLSSFSETRSPAIAKKPTVPFTS